ncbi:methyltransferase domain-containing protein [Rubripirellula reticaptiva]|uniref:Tellurite resistance protein TehB n=1 Tax=Rubripirellula reticaptiva TaxID=2528013 RepID=A0A5C6EDE4_9BACT|nr:tellurite resistance protein TehB [Rubripirellula reticaptiva]
MESSISSTRRCGACCRDHGQLSNADWQHRYDNAMTGWDRGRPSPILSRWVESGDLQPCEILVPGCGRGHEVIAFAEAGFTVTAVDFADAAVQSLEKELDRRGLQANVVQTDVFAFCQSKSFDAIYEQTSLCAIDPSQWETYQQLMACWLRPGGKLFACFMQSDKAGGPPFTCDISAMRRLFEEPTWQWPDDPVAAAERVEHPSGMHELAYILTRKESEQ